ncbi:MAG: M56 family metallopeptidase [Armatimonas sp.]
MELFLIRFLSGATLLLLAGLLGAALLQRRGPAAACAALRASLAGLVLCAIAAALPSPVRPITSIPAPAPQVSMMPEEETAWQESAYISPTEEKSSKEKSPPISAPLGPVNPTIALPEISWQIGALIVWGSGLLIGLGQLVVGHFLLARLRRSSQPMRLEMAYPVELRESGALATPLLAGCARPVLYLPVNGLLRESQEALNMALAHELAHYNRRDLAWSLLTQLLRAMLWFHPLMHWIARRQELLAEQACDEVALAQLSNRQAYARLLLSLSELPATRCPMPAASMASGRSRVGQRIKHLLSAPLSIPLSARGKVGIALSTLTTLLVGTALVGYAKKPPMSTPVPAAPSRRIVHSDIRGVVTLSVKNRPLKEVIAEVSRQSRYTITVAPALSGNISLSVRSRDCQFVLKQICPQIRPAAWFAATNFGKATGMEYALAPLPPVGKVSGQVVNSAGKPVAGVQVWWHAIRDGSSKAIPVALDYGDTTTTDAQGRFTLSRIGKRPYSVLFRPEFESGFAQKTIEVSGVPGQTVTLPAIPLKIGARIDLQFKDSSFYAALRPQEPVLQRTGAITDSTMRLRVPPGESRFVANEHITSYRILSHSGAGKWQVKNGALVVSLKEGEYAKFVVDAKLTPERERQAAARKRYLLARREAGKRDFALMRRKMGLVKVDSQPHPLVELVKDLCQQVGQTKIVIDSGISGSVKAPEHLRFFENTLKEICLQATPIAFPIWEGDVLHIVKAPERGQFDTKTHLYRLAGLDKEAVFQELPGQHHSGGGGQISWCNADRASQASVVVTDYMTRKPLAGIVLIHETPGKLRQIRTDAQGHCKIDFISGPNYYYVQPNKEWMEYASSSRGGSGGKSITLELMRKSELTNKREKDWNKLITFQVSKMPAEAALRKLFQSIGQENVALPASLTGTVTVDARNEKFSRVFSMVAHQVKPFLFPEIRNKITVRAFPH